MAKARAIVTACGGFSSFVCSPPISKVPGGTIARFGPVPPLCNASLQNGRRVLNNAGLHAAAVDAGAVDELGASVETAGVSGAGSSIATELALGGAAGGTSEGTATPSASSPSRCALPVSSSSTGDDASPPASGWATGGVVDPSAVISAAARP